MRVAVIAFFALASLLAATAAEAQVARHERVKVEPLKEKGQAVGVRIKLTLRPENYTKARVGINIAGKSYSGKSGDWRTGASDIKDGHLAHQFKEIAVKPNTPKEVTLDVRYSDAPNLKPGSSIEIVSAFNGWKNYPSHWHVYGMTSSMMANPEKYTLPKADKVAPKTEKKPAKAKAKAKPKTTTQKKKPATRSRSTSTRKKATPKPKAASKRKLSVSDIRRSASKSSQPSKAKSARQSKAPARGKVRARPARVRGR